MLLAHAVSHEKFEFARDMATTIVSTEADGCLVLVVGPSGAGKSTLLAHLKKALFGPPSSWPKHQTPLISTLASNAEKGYYNSKDVIIRLLSELGDPFRGVPSPMPVDQPLASEELGAFLGDRFWQSIRISMTEMSCRRAFERLAQAKGLKAVLLDEAQSMCLTHRNRSPSDHLESFKCLAHQLKIAIFFFGTYDLLDVWNHSAQLNRRCRTIHIGRYDYQRAKEATEFKRIVKTLGKSIAQLDESVLSRMYGFIESQTFGVFGEAEELLKRARALASVYKSPTITASHIEEAGHTPIQHARLVKEILDGESRLQGAIRCPPAMSVSSCTQRKRLPGRRNPVRDACAT